LRFAILPEDYPREKRSRRNMAIMAVSQEAEFSRGKPFVGPKHRPDQDHCPPPHNCLAPDE
jgi:hypothetical protein